MTKADQGRALEAVRRRQIEQLPIPFPPLAEQHRIVALVDELMGLCDRLEVAQSERERWRRRLLEAALHEALNSNGAPTEAPA